MKRIHSVLLSFLLIGGSIPQSIASQTIVIENSSGENFELGIDASDRFVDVLDRIQTYFQQDMLRKSHESKADMSLNGLQWNLIVSHAGLTVRAKSNARDYHASVTREQKKDITFIVTTLAWENAVDVWTRESDLKVAGDRIDLIHPLNFLYVVFSDDKLTAGISAIKDRKVPTLKTKFFKGLTNTLKEEANRENLLQFVGDFANRLDINKKKIYPYLEEGRYDDFIDKLIELKPRKGADRHNM